MTDHPHRARLGLGLIAAAAVGFRLLLPPSLTGIGRLLLIILLSILAARGLRWAAIVLSLFVAGGIFALMVGVAQLKLANPRSYLLILDAAVYAAGLTLFLVSGGSRACAPTSAAAATSAPPGA